MLLLSCALFFLIGIWVWAILYSNADDTTDGKILSIENFDTERERIVAKYGIALNGLQDAVGDDGVRFVKPTRSVSGGVDGKPENLKHDEYFDRFKSFMEKKKTAVDILKDLEVPSRDDIARRKDAERLHFASERQSNYEHELHRMVNKTLEANLNGIH